ncbi:DNA alkylation repair protein [Arthrobacter sp.]|uniref:DNA alkylation repair protein n=1 Tax=Arthrobacter sp. TaxID=1667 RepID=UPI0028117D27|nr:DNA alkylation repair protein [Arthrobacter sp.]
MGAMNELINQAAVDSLRGTLISATPGRSWPELTAAGATLDGLSLRERADHISQALLADFGHPADSTLAGEIYTTAALTFRRALQDPGFSGWAVWPVTETAVTLALDSGDAAHFDDCLVLLAELTPRLTAEFAIRRLLAANLPRSLTAVQSWALHPDEHVRRLASEGTRPYLPWAVRVSAIIDRPEATVPILDVLYRDPHEYVRRSVANHLNDLARHAPDLVIAAAARWLANPDRNTVSVVRHGLRTLIKKGHPQALALQGFAPADLSVSAPQLDRADVVLPSDLAFAFEISNTGAEPARLAVDYVVHYRKANGSRSPKVFKLATVTLVPGETKSFSKRHAFRQMTTRVHHPGKHSLELQVNGIRYHTVDFVLQPEGF